MLYIRSQFRNIYDELVFNGKGYYPNNSNGAFSVDTNMITYSRITTDKTVGGYIIFNQYTTSYFYMTFWDVNINQISTQKCEIINGRYKIKTVPKNADWVSFSFFNDQTDIDLYKIGETYPLDAAIKHEQELNGDERIDLTIEYTENNKQFLDYYEDINMWLIEYDNKEYVIINEERYGNGNYQKVECVAVLHQLFRLNTDRIYKRYDGSFTTSEAYNIVFANTPFSYVVVNSAPSSRFEGLGDGDSKLEVFKKLIDRYGHEFKIIDNVFYLYSRIGNDTNFEFRYKINANNIKKSINAENMYTYIRGYADYSDDTEDETDETETTEIPVEEKAKIKKEYTHPLAKFLGKLHAPRWADGRYKNEKLVEDTIKKIVDDSLEISFTADIVDMSEQGYPYQEAEIGDRVFLVDERINLDIEIRIVKIDKELDALGNVLNLEITFGTSDIADQYESSLNTAIKDFNDIMEGNKALPFFALNDVARSMINKINNTSSELVFDNNGIHAIDKKNANNIVTMNSSGWMLSTDGGRTAKTALTAEGIVADAITTGSLNANLITVTGGNADRYIEMTSDFLALYGTYTRRWQGETSTNNVFTRMRDGHLRFRNNDLNRSIYISDFGISTYLDGNESDASGTLEFFDYTYSGWRGVTLNSGMGVVALRTDSNRIMLDANATVNIESEKASVYIRPMKENRNGNNEFRFWVKDNPQADDTDGVLSYGSVTTGSEFGSGIRFDKNKDASFVYATNNNGDIGSGDFYARDLYGMLRAKDTNAYVGVDGALRVTDTKGNNGGQPNYKDIQCKNIQANSIRTDGGNFYIGCSTEEVRVTNNLLYNGGDIGYKPIKASDFKNASLEEYKENIEKWEFDALNDIVNETELYTFNYKSDENKETRHGLIIGEGYKTPEQLISGDSINLYAMITWAFRAIQQLNKKIEVLKNGK